jgi:hypothetical protein
MQVPCLAALLTVFQALQRFLDARARFL